MNHPIQSFFWQKILEHLRNFFFQFKQYRRLHNRAGNVSFSRIFHWYFTNIIHMHRQIIPTRPKLRPKSGSSYTDAKDLGRFGDPASYGRFRSIHITLPFSANFAANWNWIKGQNPRPRPNKHETHFDSAFQISQPLNSIGISQRNHKKILSTNFMLAEVNGSKSKTIWIIECLNVVNNIRGQLKLQYYEF